MSLDPRYRSKLWITTYEDITAYTKDDDSTAASVIHMFSDPPLWMTKMFFNAADFGKDVDGILFYYDGTARGIPDWKHENYAYDEICPIEVCAVTKQDITGNKLRWKMEQELRSVIDTYPLGSVRGLDGSAPQVRRWGTWQLHSVLYRLSYKRPVSDYTSDVTLSYGSGWTFDGDRVSGGAEGTWAETEDGCTTTSNPDVTTSPGSLYIDIDGGPAGNEAYYWANGTNLNLHSSLYTKIRIRYKTSSTSIKAKVVLEFSDASTQEVMSDASSITWAVATATITTGKTIDHIRLHADHAQGQVYYDFVHIYVADYTLPNVVELDFTPPSQNIELPIPSRVPWATQNLGAPRAIIQLTCDLDMETTTYSWTRAAAAKVSGNVDSDAGEVFLDVAHEQSDSSPWQWLAWGNKACKVTLDEPQFNYRDENMVRLVFHEHSNRDTSSDSYEERWNL